MTESTSIEERLDELTDEEHAQFVRLCEARRQREGVGGANTVCYEAGVPEAIARVLQDKRLAHRLGGLTGATETAYDYYMSNLA